MSQQILIIEDDPVYRDAIIRAFAGREHTFYEAASQSEGITALQQHQGIEVILLDLRLSSGSGEGFLKAVQGPARDYRIIVMTGHGESLTAEMASEYGVFSYLPKAGPSGDQALIFAVDQALRDIDSARSSRLTKVGNEIIRRINADEPLDDTLDYICKSVLEEVGGYTCHIRVIDLSRGDLVLGACA